MSAAAKDLDLSVLPPEYRVAFEALQATAVRAAELEKALLPTLSQDAVTPPLDTLMLRRDFPR